MSMSEPFRIRMRMSQLRTHIHTSCQRGKPIDAESAYEEMKEIVKEYPDEPDLLAALGDSGVKLVNSYIQNGMAERAKPIAMDTERLAEKINKNPQLEKQVARFLKVGYGL